MKPLRDNIALSLTAALFCYGLSACGQIEASHTDIRTETSPVYPSVQRDAPHWVTGGNKELKDIPVETIEGYTDGTRHMFNSGWVFARGEQVQAQAMDYPHERWWESVTLPHDWAIEGPFSREHNARTGGLPTHGTGWYRKTFTLPQSAL